MDEHTPPQTQTQIHSTVPQESNLVTVSRVLVNTDQEVLSITHDKLENCLNKHLSKLGKKAAWQAPFGVLLTIVVTMVTADFKDMYLSRQTWKAFFIFSGIVSFVLLIKTIIQSCGAISVEDLIQELKKGSKELK